MNDYPDGIGDDATRQVPTPEPQPAAAKEKLGPEASKPVSEWTLLDEARDWIENAKPAGYTIAQDLISAIERLQRDNATLTRNRDALESELTAERVSELLSRCIFHSETGNTEVAAFYGDLVAVLTTRQELIRIEGGTPSEKLTQPPRASHEPPAAGPDMRHPKIQALIGGQARLRIELQIVESMLEPGWEADAIDGEYWTPLHDKLAARLTGPPVVSEVATAREPPAAQGLQSIGFEPRGSQFAMVACFDSMENAQTAREAFTRAVFAPPPKGSLAGLSPSEAERLECGYVHRTLVHL